MSDHSVYHHDVTDCSGCGGNHSELPFLSLDDPMVDALGVRWKYRALCPATMQPIYLRWTKGDGVVDKVVFVFFPPQDTHPFPSLKTPDSLEDLARRVSELEGQMKTVINALTGGK